MYTFNYIQVRLPFTVKIAAFTRVNLRHGLTAQDNRISLSSKPCENDWHCCLAPVAEFWNPSCTSFCISFCPSCCYQCCILYTIELPYPCHVSQPIDFCIIFAFSLVIHLLILCSEVQVLHPAWALQKSHLEAKLNFGGLSSQLFGGSHQKASGIHQLMVKALPLQVF